MATLAPGGRITRQIVEDETKRLRQKWRPARTRAEDSILEDVLGAEEAAQLDLFDRVQLAEVLRICRRSRSLSEAGRTLFAVSRAGKTSTHDADRLKKYLARFGTSWTDIAAPPSVV
jgi:transcriptional regulatory protein RtcR